MDEEHLNFYLGPYQSGEWDLFKGDTQLFDFNYSISQDDDLLEAQQLYALPVDINKSRDDDQINWSEAQ